MIIERYPGTRSAKFGWIVVVQVLLWVGLAWAFISPLRAITNVFGVRWAIVVAVIFMGGLTVLVIEAEPVIRNILTRIDRWVAIIGLRRLLSFLVLRVAPALALFAVLTFGLFQLIDLLQSNALPASLAVLRIVGVLAFSILSLEALATVVLSVEQNVIELQRGARPERVAFESEFGRLWEKAKATDLKNFLIDLQQMQSDKFATASFAKQFADRLWNGDQSAGHAWLHIESSPWLRTQLGIIRLETNHQLVLRAFPAGVTDPRLITVSKGWAPVVLNAIHFFDSRSRQSQPRAFGYRVKGIVDTLLAVLLLIAGSSIIFLIAFWLMLDLRTPKVLIKSKRFGLNGAPFEMFRFQVLRHGSVCGVGKFLLLTGLHKLPELLNVVNGDMSFIGPHPMYLGTVALEVHRGENVERFERRFAVKPGITGLAQYCSYTKEGDYFSCKYYLALDRFYVRAWSLSRDFELAQCLLTLFLRFLIPLAFITQAKNRELPPHEPPAIRVPTLRHTFRWLTLRRSRSAKMSV